MIKLSRDNLSEIESLQHNVEKTKKLRDDAEKQVREYRDEFSRISEQIQHLESFLLREKEYLDSSNSIADLNSRIAEIDKKHAQLKNDRIVRNGLRRFIDIAGDDFKLADLDWRDARRKLAMFEYDQIKASLLSQTDSDTIRKGFYAWLTINIDVGTQRTDAWANYLASVFNKNGIVME